MAATTGAMRLLYLYPEEWTGRRAREMHTLSTCVALARAGADVTLVTAGGRRELQRHGEEIAGQEKEPGLRLVPLSRSLGPIRSAALFAGRFEVWRHGEKPFDAAYIIHLKAAAILRREGIAYLYEAHEVFAETTQKNQSENQRLHDLEREVLANATWRVATSRALAVALRAHYILPDDFAVAPNAGLPSLPQSVARADGPLVYAGSIADWKGLDLIINAAAAEGQALKIVGGTVAEWKELSRHLKTDHVAWVPRVTLGELPLALAGAQAGVIPTQPGAPSGRYSCPMKLFDYARCGLPVISSKLPALQSLDVGSWCTQVEKPTKEAWAQALRDYRFRPVQAETARAWAGVHTWKERAQTLMRILAHKPKGSRGW